MRLTFGWRFNECYPIAITVYLDVLLIHNQREMTGHPLHSFVQFSIPLSSIFSGDQQKFARNYPTIMMILPSTRRAVVTIVHSLFLL